MCPRYVCLCVSVLYCVYNMCINTRHVIIIIMYIRTINVHIVYINVRKTLLLALCMTTRKKNRYRLEFVWPILILITIFKPCGTSLLSNLYCYTISRCAFPPWRAANRPTENEKRPPGIFAIRMHKCVYYVLLFYFIYFIWYVYCIISAFAIRSPWQ